MMEPAPYFLEDIMSINIPKSPYALHRTGHFGDDLTVSQVCAAASRRERLANFLHCESLRLWHFADINVMERYAAQIGQEAAAEQQGGRHAHA